MIKLVYRAVIALVALLMATVVAYAAWRQNQQIAAVDNSILGTWYGVIGAGFPYKEPRRNLTISFEENTPRCVWEELGKKPDFLTCVVEGTKVSLKTGAGSTVDMELGAASLKGTFILKDGRSYPIEMGRTTALHQIVPKVLGPPITCEARGYFSGAPIQLVIRKLDRRSRKVDLDYVDISGLKYTKAGSLWTFDGSILKYNRYDQVAYHLSMVGPSIFKGSYDNYKAPGLSKKEIEFLCDGPIEQVMN